MSEWITDRPPESKDSGELFWATDATGTIKLRTCEEIDRWFKHGSSNGVVAWLPVKAPEPYVPPKPKRERFHCSPGGVPREFVEVLPGDIDPDKALAIKERMESVANALEVVAIPNRLVDMRSWLQTTAAKLRGEQ